MNDWNGGRGEAQAEVRNFAEFLIEKKKRKKAGFIRQNWGEGGACALFEISTHRWIFNKRQWNGGATDVSGRYEHLAGTDAGSVEVG